MGSKIIYKDQAIDLIDEFVDVGYMAEEFCAVDSDNNECSIKRTKKNISMIVLFSVPNYEEYQNDIQALDKFLFEAKVGIDCYLVFDSFFDGYEMLKNKLDKFCPIFDINSEFGELYGTKLESGILKGKLTKALFVISKDGAIFYIDMPGDISKPIDLQRLQYELNRAYTTYTGVGCHG